MRNDIRVCVCVLKCGGLLDRRDCHHHHNLNPPPTPKKQNRTGAFLSPFQDAPLDLDFPPGGFYARRKDGIEARLTEIAEMRPTTLAGEDRMWIYVGMGPNDGRAHA